MEDQEETPSDRETETGVTERNRGRDVWKIKRRHRQTERPRQE